jgi:hypothetical protein
MYALFPFRVSFLPNIFPQNLASETAAYLTTKHPDYAVLAHRRTSPTHDNARRGWHSWLRHRARARDLQPHV